MTLRPALVYYFDSKSLSSSSSELCMRWEVGVWTGSPPVTNSFQGDWVGMCILDFTANDGVTWLIHSKNHGKLAGRRQLCWGRRVEWGKERKPQEEKSRLMEAGRGSKGHILGVGTE